jgi:hypothetical protein
MQTNVLRLAFVVAAAAGLALVAAAVAAPSTLPKRAVVPLVSSADPTPTPTPTATPRPRPYVGPISSIYLKSASILGGAPIEERDTVWVGGREFFEDPSAPQYISWYPRFGRPGFAASNTMVAAHVNYVGYGNGPFVGLLQADVDDALYVTMGNGEVITYTVKSVNLYKLSELDMDPVVFPVLDSTTERITLISCGGTFIPNPSGVGGDFDSRIVLVAERFVP